MSNDASDGTKPNPSPEGSPKGSLDRLITAFESIVLGLPTAFRTLIVIVALLIVGGVAAYHYRPVPQQVTPQTPTSATPATPPPASVATFIIKNDLTSQPYPNGNGSADPTHAGADNHNPQNVESNHKSAEDDAAYSFHFSGPEKLPEEQSIGTDLDKDNYLHFRYFEATDKCLFVIRRQKGTNHPQWLRDPNNNKHDIDVKPSTELKRSSPTLNDSPPAQLAQLLEQVLPTAAYASSTFDPPVASDPPQANFCFNPHPGNFRYWWGPPIDQCNSPMYRQFGDGCTHYQVYNRCSNSWDGRINWTACHPPPHH